jgi:predicted GNAT superfamily acetyltransferase
MTAIDLSHLTISEQLDLLYSEGIYLAKRKFDARFILLFQYKTVYVEIYYLEYRKRVDRIVYSEDIAVLDPYLGEIRLDILNK